MEWGILLVFSLLLSAILAVLAKVILDDIATADKTKRSQAKQRQAAQLLGKGG